MGEQQPVATSLPRPGKPRVRKTAPTVRERVEAAAAKEETVKSNRIKSGAAKVSSPFKKLRLGERKTLKIIVKPLRPVGRVLRWLVPKYLVNSWREVRQVTWTSRRETWRLTLAVFIFAIVFGALVAGVDKGLDELFKKVVLK